MSPEVLHQKQDVLYLLWHFMFLICFVLLVNVKHIVWKQFINKVTIIISIITNILAP